MQPMRIIFKAFGKPAEVAEAESWEGSEPGAGEVRVRMHYAPVNPADINYMEGTYGKRPELPAVPGNEGAGEVIGVGEGVDSVAAGDSVILFGKMGLWQSDLVVPAEQVIRLPDGIDFRQASMLKVNPPTAWLLIRELEEPVAGEWIAQNAANSGVGRSVIQLARDAGMRTVNFVRRAELFSELEDLGADLFFLDNDEGHAEAKARGLHPRLAFNAVGGDSALRLMDLLAPEGVHVTYGAMSRRSLKVPNSFLIFKQIQLRGLWISRWMERASREEIETMFADLAGRMASGRLVLPVEAAYPPERVAEALAHAQRPGRAGKILLAFDGDC